MLGSKLECLMVAIPASFLFSNATNFAEINCRLRTGIVGVEGEQADHWTVAPAQSKVYFSCSIVPVTSLEQSTPFIKWSTNMKKSCKYKKAIWAKVHLYHFSWTYSNSTKLESEICLITVLLIMLKLSSRSLGTDQVIMTNPVSNTRCLMVGPTIHWNICWPICVKRLFVHPLFT